MARIPPEHHRAIVRHLMGVWKDSLKVIEMTAKGSDYMQPQIVCEGFPNSKYCSFATVGLSDHCKYELATIGPRKFKSISKALFDVASFVASGNRALKEGEVFEKVLSHYYPAHDAVHWYIRREAPVGAEAGRANWAKGSADWLWAWPITSEELILKKERGEAVICRALDIASTVAFDLGRGSLPGVPAFDPWAQ